MYTFHKTSTWIKFQNEAPLHAATFLPYFFFKIKNKIKDIKSNKKKKKKKKILFSSAKCPSLGVVGKEWASKKH